MGAQVNERSCEHFLELTDRELVALLFMLFCVLYVMFVCVCCMSLLCFTAVHISCVVASSV